MINRTSTEVLGRDLYGDLFSKEFKKNIDFMNSLFKYLILNLTSSKIQEKYKNDRRASECTSVNKTLIMETFRKSLKFLSFFWENPKSVFRSIEFNIDRSKTNDISYDWLQHLPLATHSFIVIILIFSTVFRSIFVHKVPLELWNKFSRTVCNFDTVVPSI